MLRPQYLVDARAARRAGELSSSDLESVEDRAVDEALAIQEEAGVDVVTDGEMRRDIFLEFFMSGMTGLSMVGASRNRMTAADPADEIEITIPFSVTDRLRVTSNPALREFLYARDRTTKPVKVTLPGPLMLLLGFWNEHSTDAYPDPFDLAADGVAIVGAWMRELADAGCPYIQIDAPDLAQVFADEAVRAQGQEKGIDMDRYMHEGVEMIGSLAELELGPGVTVGLHVCKGNGTRSWSASGGYDAFSREVFARAGGFDVYHLEYDDDRSGSFEPLANLADDRMAVLGLVSTKWTTLEDAAGLERRVQEAAHHHPMDRLGIATQCGFASAGETAQLRQITAETQVDKLALVASVARSLWADN